MLNSTSDRNRWKRSESLEAIGIAGSDRNRWKMMVSEGIRMAWQPDDPIPVARRAAALLLAYPPPFEQRAHLRAATHCLANFSAFALPPGGQRHTLPGQTRPGREFSPGPGPVRRPCPQPAWYMHYTPIPGAPPGPSAQPDWSDPGVICILIHLRRRRRSSCASWPPCRSRPTRPPPACTSGR